MIEGIALHPLEHISVPNGDVFHALRCTDEGFVGFGEAYFAQIESGKAKGWKRHNKMTLSFYGADRTTSMLMDIIPEPHNPSEADKKELFEIIFDFEGC